MAMESPRCRRDEYFSRGFCIALTIGLSVAAVELAVLLPVLAGAATDVADGEWPALLVDANHRSIYHCQPREKENVSPDIDTTREKDAP
jgi:hypothetical protein